MAIVLAYILGLSRDLQQLLLVLEQRGYLLELLWISLLQCLEVALALRLLAPRQVGIGRWLQGLEDGQRRNALRVAIGPTAVLRLGLICKVPAKEVVAFLLTLRSCTP